MASIPLPALDVKPPQPVDALGSYEKLVALRGMQNQQALQQQQIQSGQQEQQIRQQQITDQQATTAAMKDWDGKDYDALTKSVLDHGGSANAASAIQQHGLTIKKTVSDIAAQDAKTGSSNLETFTGKQKAIGDALEGIEQVPDEQLHQAAIGKIADLAKGGIFDPQTAAGFVQKVQSIQDPQQLRQVIDQTAKSAMGAKAAADQAKTEADTQLTNATAAQKRMESDFYSRTGVGAPGVPAEQVQMADAMRLGRIKSPSDYPGFKAAQDAKATLPFDLAKKKAEQSIADGDPNAAAQLLVSGAVAPSQIISSRKPAFAQQAFTAAQQLNPQWNAQRAEGDYKVAGSPTNVAFFGSAKSLTEKGGTLDQLADAAKDIPQGQVPVFNTVADAIKASTGSGPIAKYASIALGVADDYSKVMGGGQGSDSSREQALHLVSASASPEQRAGSIEGIRGAVGSQIHSRIGNNQVLKNMYGESTESKSGASPETRNYQGHTYTKQPDGSWKLQ